MKKKAIGLALILALAAGPAYAGPVTLLWNPGSDSTSTDVEQSVDNGTTWTVVRNVSHIAPACNGTPMTCSTVHPAPDTGLVLFRFVSVNAVGKTIRTDAGPWHNAKWITPGQATNVGSR